MTNQSEILMFFGDSKDKSLNDETWKFSISKREWMFLKGKRQSTQNIKPSFNELNVFDDNFMIGGRKNVGGWISNCKDIITFFGGNGYVLDDASTITNSLNEIWMYNVSKNSYSVVKCNECGEFSTPYFGNYTKINEYDPLNTPGGRSHHTIVSLNEEIFLFGGEGYLHTNYHTSKGETIRILPDWWMFSRITFEWKYLGGEIIDLIQYSNIVLGTTNVYDSKNSIGHVSKSAAVLINEEEILKFGGLLKNRTGDSFPEDLQINIVQKYNITSNMWKKVSGDINDEIITSFSRDYDNANHFGGRSQHKIWKINEKEILIFGGYGYSIGDSNELNDEWRFNFKTNKFRFTGKDPNAIYRPRTVLNITTRNGTQIINNEPYAENTIMGGLYDFTGQYLSNSKELIVIGGFGICVSFYGQYLDDVWRIYNGNICNLIEDTDPNVCLKRGQCIGYNFCQCEKGFFGND